jgi:hypothetical protein
MGRTKQGWHRTSKDEADRREAGTKYADRNFKIRPFHNVRLVPSRVDCVGNIHEKLKPDG